MNTRRRLALALLAAVALVVGPLAGSASAHVRVSSTEAVQGAYADVTFRVPTEKDSATTKVDVALPADAPFAAVLVQPKEGWSYQLTKAAPAVPLKDDDGNTISEVVTRITWTATGPGVKPDEFDTFTVLAGPLPKVSAVTFKTVQTYADGSVVSWIEDQAAGAPEPEFPAPTLALAAASAGTGMGMGSATTGASASPSMSATPVAAAMVASSEPTPSAPTWLAALALVLAVLGCLAGGYAAVVSRRRAPAA